MRRGSGLLVSLNWRPKQLEILIYWRVAKVEKLGDWARETRLRTEGQGMKIRLT
jgi:hypothetical protein